VERPLFDAVLGRMAERYRALRVGPALADPDVGPLISARQREMVERYLALAGSGVDLVAQSRLGDDLPPGGFYVPPTLLAGADPAHRLAQEEIFGPVQLVMPFDDEAQALALANGTAFGLVAGVWTRDGSRALRLARRLQCGQVFINNYGAGGGIELPFGGVKLSGHGREKGFEALYGFSALKTVAILHG
jgi:aldehyde dehydrogenase (NAD+)